MTTIDIGDVTQAAIDHRKTASNALNRAMRLHEQLAAAQNALRSLGQAYADLKTDNDELGAIVKAAEYQCGARPCMEGDCDHAYEADDNAPDNAPCPLIVTRHATAAEILAVELLLMSSDGDPLDDAEEIPVGEIRRVMGEARTAVNV